MPVKNAVLYLRSSKDRSDVSIDAQRRQLEELAGSRNLSIVDEFADVVLSGKDDNRPAFQSLLRELKSRDRGWNVILALDTSRIARNQWIAHSLRHECKKRGVELLFAMTPELDGVAGIMLPAVLHAVDEVHSFLSREKGLAGMAENVRQGWRAGGKPPWGYELERVATGAIREGEPVLKSRLVAGKDFAIAQTYLQGRAAGRSAQVLVAELGIRRAASSLVGTEWNALTYAGHTVWNTHAPHVDGGYVGGTKRRPRSDWVIRRDTHAAAITDVEAEAILARLDRPRKTRRRGEAYLLTGLLKTPLGVAWHGGNGAYRVGAKRIDGARLERAVLGTIMESLRGGAFARILVAEARATRPRTDEAEELLAIETAIAKAERSIATLTAALEETTAKRPLLARIEELELQIRESRTRSTRLAEEARQAKQLREISEADVQAWLGEVANQVDEMDRGNLKDLLAGLVDRIEYEPGSPTCRICFRSQLGGDKVASPQRFAGIAFRGVIIAEVPLRKAA